MLTFESVGVLKIGIVGCRVLGCFLPCHLNILEPVKPGTTSNGSFQIYFRCITNILIQSHPIARPLPRRNLGDAFGRSGPLGPASRKRFCQVFSLGLVSFQRYRVERWLFLQTSESYLDQISVSEISMCVFRRGLVRVVDIYVSYFRYVMIRLINLWFFLCWAQNSIEAWVCQGYMKVANSKWLTRSRYIPRVSWTEACATVSSNIKKYRMDEWNVY